MSKIKTFKTRIYITPEVEHQFNMGFGTRRWVWNWVINQYFTEQVHLSNFKFDMMLNKLIRENVEEYGWIPLVNTCIKTNALKDFNTSLTRYYRELKRHKPSSVLSGKNKYQPKFQKKKSDHQSFRLSKKHKYMFSILGNNTFDFTWTKSHGRIKVRTRENIIFLKQKNIKEVTIIKEAGKFFICFSYENTNNENRQKGNGKIGLDLGVKHLFTSFDGHNFTVFNANNFSIINSQIAKLNRKLRRKVYNSKNYWKTVIQMQKWYNKAFNIKKDQYYKAAVSLCRHYNTIIVDDFNYEYFLEQNREKGKIGRHAAIRRIQEVSPCLFKSILQYKTEEFGVNLIFVKHGTPTTQTCSHCGRKVSTRVELKDRTFRCDHCNFVLDRDKNAAINVFNYI